jgi:hypothetical protein
MAGATLDENVLQFLQRRVVVSLASCNHEGIPSLVRCVGFRILDKPQRVAVFMRANESPKLVADIRASGRVAVVFSEPSTHRSLQIKGDDAQIGALEDGDAALIERHRESVVAELVPLGYPARWLRTVVDTTALEVLAVRFTPGSAFAQTPGPRAGAPLAGAQP